MTKFIENILLIFMLQNKYHLINHVLYFHTKSIWRHKFYYYFVQIRSMLKLFDFSGNNSCILFGMEGLSLLQLYTQTLTQINAHMCTVQCSQFCS